MQDTGSSIPVKGNAYMSGGYVLLFHGICRSSRQMQPLERKLSRQGFDVRNIDYPSTRYDLSHLADMVWEQYQACWKELLPLNFVGFSMGGLLVRVLLNRYKPAVMGRVVQLAPPNQGSEVADFLRNIPFFKWIYGPAGQQLVTDQSAIRELLGTPDYPLGILAGNRSIDPFSSCLIRGPDDGKVSVARTKLPEMSAHMVLPACHTWFPQHPGVIRQTVSFLADGYFV